MRRIRWCCGLLALGVLAYVPVAKPQSAAAQASALTDVQKLERSQRQWVTLRQAWGNSYRYLVPWQSAFGFGHDTTLVVEQGKVVRREYQAWGRTPDGQSIQKSDEWVETGSEVGARASGASPLTLDQLYETCRLLLQAPMPPDTSQTVLFDERGVLQACFRSHWRIADDAPKSGVPYFELLGR